MTTQAPDPRERAIQRLRVAQSAWGEAMTAHKRAPPDLGFAARLRSLAAAAEREREACEDADRAGLLWRPIPGVHTLNFEPYRVDLTPFAAILSTAR